MTDLAEQEAAWHAWRRGDDLPETETAVTASVIAAASTGRYGGMYARLAERLGYLKNDINPALADRGHKWEPAITQMVYLATGLYVVGEQAWAQHPEHPWKRATTDGFLAPHDPATLEELDSVLEVKTRGTHATGPQPWDYWTAQCQWQMHVTGLPRAVLAVAYIDDITGKLTGLKIHEIDADYAHQIQLETIAEEYRWYYANNQLPVRDDANLDHVKAVGPAPDTDPDAINLDTTDTEWDTLLAEYRDAKKHATEADKTRQTLEARILQTLRRHQATAGTTATGWKVKLSAPARIVNDEAKAALMAAYPELGETRFVGSDRAKQLRPDEYEAARKPIGSRRLTITPPKGTK